MRDEKWRNITDIIILVILLFMVLKTIVQQPTGKALEKMSEPHELPGQVEADNAIAAFKAEEYGYSTPSHGYVGDHDDGVLLSPGTLEDWRRWRRAMLRIGDKKP